FPLRKGTEVLFTFLGGDPDRPLIAGVVPNLVTPSPVNAANHTKNVVQTGGKNRIELEDKAGEERITISTPHANSYLQMGAPREAHQMISHSKAATLLDAGEALMIKAGGDENVTITDFASETYKSGLWTTVESDYGCTLTVTGGGLFERITGFLSTDVTKDLHE